jgi:acyl-CoA thioester hydrolase
MENGGRVGVFILEGEVLPEWIDMNGHMNVAYYVLAFDHAVDELFARLGISDEYIRKNRGSTFAVESHVTWQQELKEGERYVVTSQIAAYDAKRIHQFQRMYHADEHYLAATAEWMNLHVDLDKRRVCPWPATTLDRLRSFVDQQGAFVNSAEIGKRMNVRKPEFRAGTAAGE